MSDVLREGVVDRLAIQIGMALKEIRPDLKLTNGLELRYPDGEAPLDLRNLAEKTISLGTYTI